MTAPKPGSLRAQILAESRRICDGIMQMLAESNEGVTVAAMCNKLGGESQAMRQRLTRFMEADEIHSVIVTTCGLRLVLYFLGPAESKRGKQGTQRTVSKWKPQTIKHDPLHTAFFGAKQQQGE